MRIDFKKFIVWGAVTFGVIAIILNLAIRPVPEVEAQSGSVSFSLNFQVPASSFTTYIAVPNRNQIGHTINFAYATSPGGALLANCGIFFDTANSGDGSTSGSNWTTLAASGNPFGQQTGSFSGDGYSTFYRLKIPTCIQSAIKITYVGYFSQIPISPLPFPGWNRVGTGPQTVSTVVRADPLWATPGVLNGWQCSNPDGTNQAWLQLSVGSTAPALGAGMVTVLIPPAQTVTFAGPSISYFGLTLGSATANTLYAAATTTATSTAAVSTPIICNFQTNGTGPYYPFNPPSL